MAVRTVLAFIVISALAGGAAGAVDTGVLQIEAKIPLGSVSGRIDHMAIDLSRRRLFVAELGNDSVSVVDLDARKVIHRISGLKEPQGVAYVQSADSLYVANGGDGSVRIYRGAHYTAADRIDLGADADNIRVDGISSRLLIGYGNGAIGVIDLSSKARIKNFALKAHPESFQLDTETQQLFVNLPNTRSIAVLDGNTGQERAVWLQHYGGNFPMALNPERQQVLVVFRNPAMFAAFSWQTGALVAEVETCGDADDLFLDRKRQRVYISCGAGFIDVLQADNPAFSRIARIRTASGARTALFVPEIDRLLLAVRSGLVERASIWVYRTAP